MMGIKAVQYHPDYCEEAKADLAENGRKPYSRFDTSHDLSVIDAGGERHRVGSFKHAGWAHAVGQLIEAHGSWPIELKESD